MDDEGRRLRKNVHDFNGLEGDRIHVESDASPTYVTEETAAGVLIYVDAGSGDYETLREDGGPLMDPALLIVGKTGAEVYPYIV